MECTSCGMRQTNWHQLLRMPGTTLRETNYIANFPGNRWWKQALVWTTGRRTKIRSPTNTNNPANVHELPHSQWKCLGDWSTTMLANVWLTHMYSSTFHTQIIRVEIAGVVVVPLLRASWSVQEQGWIAGWYPRHLLQTTEALPPCLRVWTCCSLVLFYAQWSCHMQMTMRIFRNGLPKRVCHMINGATIKKKSD